MKKLKVGLVTGFLAVSMLLAFSGAASASDWPGPIIYGDDWPENYIC